MATLETSNLSGDSKVAEFEKKFAGNQKICKRRPC